jgi:hypothetical protein
MADRQQPVSGVGIVVIQLQLQLEFQDTSPVVLKFAPSVFVEAIYLGRQSIT